MIALLKVSGTLYETRIRLTHPYIFIITCDFQSCLWEQYRTGSDLKMPKVKIIEKTPVDLKRVEFGRLNWSFRWMYSLEYAF